MKKVFLLFMGLLSIYAIFAGASREEQADVVVLKWPTIWVGEDSKAGIVATLVDEFNQTYAGQYRVDIEANPDYDGYRTKLNAQMAAGAVPDLFIFNPDPTSFAFYEGDFMMDFAEELSGSWGDDFVSGAIDNATISGETKSIPYEVGYTPVWYNMDILEKAGVSAVPTNYDEFWEVTEKIKQAGYVPTSQMTGGANAWTSMLWFSHISASIGGPTVWEREITDDVFVQAAGILARMFADGNTTRDAIGGDAGVSGGHFLSERTAMFINGPWYIGRVQSDAPAVFESVQVGAAPAVSGGYEGAQIGFPLSNLAAAHTDDPAKREATLAFMKWMTNPENVKKIALDSGAMFAVKFAVGSGEQFNRLQTQFTNAVNEASFVIPHFQSNFDTDVVAEFGQALAKMALGEATPQEFVQQIADKIK